LIAFRRCERCWVEGELALGVISARAPTPDKLPGVAGSLYYPR
jgi:hypothetical protein